MFKKVRPARRSPFDARSVHGVREHGKRARTPLAAFFNIPIVERHERAKGHVTAVFRFIDCLIGSMGIYCNAVGEFLRAAIGKPLSDVEPRGVLGEESLEAIFNAMVVLAVS